MPELQEPQLEKKKTYKWFQLLLVFSALVLGIGYTLRLLTPTKIEVQPTLNRNYQGSTTRFEKVTFVGTTPDLPKELVVATAENFVPLNFEDRTIKDKLIAQYKLQRNPNVPELWVSPDYALQEIPSTGSYELSTQVALPVDKIADSLTALETAQKFVAAVLPGNNLQLLDKKVVYRDADAHGDITEPTQAGLIDVPFGFEIDSYPIYLEKSLEYPVRVMINADNQIQKATFHPFFLTPKIDGKIKTLTVAEALANINANKATIISSYYEGFESESLEQITSAALNTITIEYRVSSDTKRIVPYYRFSGQLINAQGQQFYGEIITPAVQTEDAQS